MTPGAGQRRAASAKGRDLHRAELDREQAEGTKAAAAIQSCGALLVLTPGWLVAQASANLADHFGVLPGAVIGRPATELFSEAAVHGLRNRLALKRAGEGVTRLTRCRLAGDERAFDVALHYGEEAVIVELQPSSEPAIGSDWVTTVRAMIGGLGQLAPAAGFEEGTRLVRALTGFDRVHVHRRTADGWAMVGAAVRTGEASAADDCAPAPVALDRLTVVADCDSPAVALLGDPPCADVRGALEATLLAAPSPALLAGLRLAGARAMMTVPLIIAGRPWGMISCRHGGARLVEMARQSAAELFAQMWALRIELGELRGTI